MAGAKNAGNRFPRPVKLGRVSAWPESEVLAWIERQKAQRDTA
jgi:predicted DNA-binding transcriptional regulator AlpA